MEDSDSLGADRRIKLTLHYDGAGFFGWQVQPGARTVQAELESALSRLADQPITVIAAGRTDRGVHAIGQVASTAMPMKWPAAEVMRALNAVLPKDIWVAAADDVPWAFNARYDALARNYIYRVGTVPEASSPFYRRWCWPLREEPNLELFQDAAQRLIGQHSFAAFAKAGQPERGEMCTITHAEWSRWECGVQFDVTADRFLHHMVRYLVGTMVDIALGRRPLSDIHKLLQDRGSLETSPPAPPEGLFLAHVEYGAPTKAED